MADDDTPRNADFIGRVVSDPKNPPETRMLTGWLGDAADEGYRRLYTNAELSAYVDIPVDAILHTEPIRDVQPSGGVFVWIRRDAALNPGGTASSRAARFLRGQVQQDFASGGGAQDFSSPEKAGYRCVTQVPCGEPTGFTGQCTKQPEVGGGWPCITAIPHCAEPTGFTGQCTHQPWPNPTCYIGCTVFHCPTQDLTHNPHICNLIATGMPGCAAADPRGGGEAAKAEAVEGNEGPHGAAEQPAGPATSLPGCGYTQTWGLCETRLLGCGFTKQWGCQPTQPPKCNVSVDIPCITQTETPRCFQGGGFPAFAAAPGTGGQIDTQVLQCNPSAVDACPTRFGCKETQPPTALALCTQQPPCPSEPTILPETCPPTWCGPKCQTPQPGCTELNCTQAGPQCRTIPDGDCTFFGGCHPTPAAPCTQSGPQCPSQFGSGCPTDTSLDCTFGCTQVGPSCPTINFNCETSLALNCTNRMARQIGPVGVLGPTSYRNCPTRQFECTMFCTQAGVGCPTSDIQCTTQICPPVMQGQGPAAQAFAAAPQAAVAGPQIRPLTIPVWVCPMPTPATRCFICGPSQLPWRCPLPSPWCPPITQTFRCGGGGPSAVDACPTRLCGGGA